MNSEKPSPPNPPRRLPAPIRLSATWYLARKLLAQKNPPKNPAPKA